MNFEDALQVRAGIASFLKIDRPLTRTGGRPRVAVGIAPTDRLTEFRIAIRAQTREDLEREFASGKGAKVEEMAGSELDIRFTGPIRTYVPAEPVIAERFLRLGASVSHQDLPGAGTLGFFARRIVDGTLGIVSNNHVLAICDRGKDRDAIVHPGCRDGGIVPADVIAYLDGSYPRLDEPDPVDCAFAPVREGLVYDPSTITNGLRLHAAEVPLRDQREVLKIGRSTRVTRGRITGLAIQNLDIDYGFSKIYFNRQIEISGIDDEPFAKRGDSGSLVVNHDGHPLGLTFASTFDCRTAYAHPIGDVLSSLGVTVVV